MRPAVLARPSYLADPPPACLTDAMEGAPRCRTQRRSYWSLVLRGLRPWDQDQARIWLARVLGAARHQGPGTQAPTRPRSRSRGPEPGPTGAERGAPSAAGPSRVEHDSLVSRPSRAGPVGRPSRASHLEPLPEPGRRPLPPGPLPHRQAAGCLESVESLEPVRAPVPPGPVPHRPAAGCLESTESLVSTASLEPVGAPVLLLISKPRHEAGFDVERAWTVDCQFLWIDAEEGMEEHLGLHPLALLLVAPRLGPILAGVRDAVADLESEAPLGCLNFECDDGRTASVAAACLVAHLLLALGRPHRVEHLGLEYDSHQQMCPACCGPVPAEAAETVLRLWRALPPYQESM